jgi:beta-phosphoglucomutase
MVFGAIFDMDGVLVDSHDIIWKSQNAILAKYGVHLSEEDIAKYLGKTLKDDIEDWNRIYGLSLDLKTQTEESWKMQVELLKDIRADSDLVSLLSDLKSHHVPMSVGTSSVKFRAEKILEILNLKEYFPVMISANDVQKHKPHPDVFVEAARRMNMDPKRCVVFEDAYSGIEAAKRGGMKAIGYLGKHNDASQIRNADLIIDSFSGVSYEKLYDMFC